jgi:transposase
MKYNPRSLSSVPKKLGFKYKEKRTYVRDKRTVKDG